MTAPLLPSPPEQYQSGYFAQLLRTLRTYFVQLEAVRHINIASCNINLDTLPTTDTGARDGDVWVDGNTLKVAGLAGGSGGVAWGSITGTLSNQTDLQTALNGKSNTGHTHAISDVTGLQTALDGKQAAGSYAAASHTHAISDVTNLQTTLDGKASVNINKIQNLGSVSGNVSVNLTLGQIATATCTGACNWSFTNLTSGEVNNITLVLTNPGAGTQTFPTGTVFDRNAAPVLPAAGKTALMFETYDNGSNWAAAQVWRNVA